MPYKNQQRNEESNQNRIIQSTNHSTVEINRLFLNGETL